MFGFLKTIIDRGHMAMFSDFSLKALIHEWKESYGLGPNPFVKFSKYSGKFVLRYDPNELISSPSAQLKTVGELTENGRCEVYAMSNTIVYSVDKRALGHDHYQLKVLTIVETIVPSK